MVKKILGLVYKITTYQGDIPLLPLKQYIDHLQPGIISVAGNENMPIVGATNDSRRVKPGWLFVAVSGAVDDGHRYLEQVLAAGAAAVVSERELKLPAGVAGIQVADAYAAVAGAAEVMYGFPARQLELIGITGTNGKTTTAFLLRDIFKQNGEKVGMVGTVGYDCGGSWETAARTTPDPFILQSLFARMVKNGCRRAILEVSSHALIQNRLGESHFCGAIFTNLSGDHLDYHKNMENYYIAKRILFKQLLLPDAMAVINGDDLYGQRLIRELAGCRVVTWGKRYRNVNYQLRIIKEDLAGQTAQLTGNDGTCRWQAPLVGRYNADNMAAAFLLALGLGVARDKIVAALLATAGVPGRLQAVSFPNNSLALVDYAHTDDALLKVLQTLKELPHKRLIVVFGCGGDRDRQKRPRMGKIAADYADLIIITNDNPRNEEPEVIAADILVGVPAAAAHEIILDRRQAIVAAVKMLQADDILLLAGKGHEDYQEIAGKREYFDDRVELLRLRG